jgi:DNA invertase Pin-like site-specific DNA recombinase
MTSDKTAGYVRVRGLGADQLVEERMVRLQTQRIIRECGRCGWLLDELFIDRGEAAGDPSRPGLAAALELVHQGGHAALIVAVFDRLARPDTDFVALSAVAHAEGWRLIVAR